MATKFTPDDRAAALKLYAVNHAEADAGDMAAEFLFWKNSESKTAIPWGKDRDTAIVAAGTHLGVTVDATSPWLREQQFWTNYRAKPPTALA
jgi:hypothetical protein